MDELELQARLRPARRGMYVLPSLLTAGNIAAGFYAMLQSIVGTLHGDSSAFNRAALAIALAALFDGLDGRVARMTNTQSEFGREFDSLADVITFGVAPALMAYLWGIRPVEALASNLLEIRALQMGAAICFIFLICGACRLARFNISMDPQPRNPGRPGKKYFVGMPIPAGAGVIAAVIHFERGSPIATLSMAYVWTLLIAATSFLMVSSWRFWSAKELNLSERKPVRSVVMLLVAVTLVIAFSEYALLALAMAYLVSGVLARLAYSWQRHSRQTSAS
jgi:CDP-diacylglycerol--serine O-phosphatidyltransferase